MSNSHDWHKEFLAGQGYARDENTFIREVRRIRSLPRVLKGKDLPRQEHKRMWVQFLADSTAGCPIASFLSWIEHFAPGARSYKHGHENEAVFYILEGRGYDIHDGVRHDWQAGDVVIVPNGCVHQHFNADPARPARALVINPKPMYMLFNMKQQRLVEPSPDYEGH